MKNEQMSKWTNQQISKSENGRCELFENEDRSYGPRPSWSLFTCRRVRRTATILVALCVQAGCRTATILVALPSDERRTPVPDPDDGEEAKTRRPRVDEHLYRYLARHGQVKAVLQEEQRIHES